MNINYNETQTWIGFFQHIFSSSVVFDVVVWKKEQKNKDMSYKVFENLNHFEEKKAYEAQENERE